MSDAIGTEGLLTALLAVQAEAPKLPKDGTNPHYKSKFTKLETIVEKVGPILNRNGLVWNALPSRSAADGKSVLRYRLSHAPTGEVLEGEMDIMLAKPDAQAQGSAITYARRYALCAVLNLVADDDDDGNGASGGQTGGDASAAQKRLVRTLFTQKGVTLGEAKKLLGTAGVVLADGESPRDAVDRLSKAACSQLIEFLKDGPMPTGESDVPAPADDEFTHPPVDDDVFSPEVPS